MDTTTTPPGPVNLIDVDSIEIAAPGQGRVTLWLTDTAGATIATTGPVSVKFEVSGSATTRRILVIDASAPGISKVIVTNNGGGKDSIKVVATAIAFRSVAVASGFACGIAMDDRAWCWGANGRRQLGAATPNPCYGSGCQYGDGGSAILPLPVMGGRTFASVATAGLACTLNMMIGVCGSSCAITAGGETWCWGFVSTGGTAEPTRFGPDRQMSMITTAQGFPQGFDPALSVCGLASGGEAYCLSQTGSTRVGGTMTFSAFATSPTHSCGISAGDVYCWGSNSDGELGIGTTDTQTHSAPEKAVVGATFTAIAAGRQQTCALSTAKQIYCWGKGSGTPQPVGGGGTYESLSMPTSSSSVAMCALTSAGAVDCWTSFGSAPTAVQSPVALSRISVGGVVSNMSVPIDPPFGCGLSAADEAYCWKADYVAKKLGFP